MSELSDYSSVSSSFNTLTNHKYLCRLSLGMVGCSVRVMLPALRPVVSLLGVCVHLVKLAREVYRVISDLVSVGGKLMPSNHYSHVYSLQPSDWPATSPICSAVLARRLAPFSLATEITSSSTNLEFPIEEQLLLGG